MYLKNSHAITVNARNATIIENGLERLLKNPNRRPTVPLVPKGVFGKVLLGGSFRVSTRMGMEIVRLVAPAAKVSVPLAEA